MGTEEIEKLKKINEKFFSLSNSSKNIVEEYLSYNVDFHNVFILASKNNKLIEILEGLSKNFQRFKGILVAKADRSRDAYVEHLKIIEAFEKKDSVLAENTVREHINSSWRYLRKFINKEDNGL
jgi:DNA-binding GntR family transcriptional regulator